jgi:hypothetical protein
VERDLRRAADVCDHVIRDNRKIGKERTESQRVLNTQRAIEQLLRMVASLGRIDSLSAGEDPDFVSEESRSRMAAELRKQKRLDKLKKQQEVVNGEEE